MAEQGCSEEPFLMFYQGNLKGIGFSRPPEKKGSDFFAPQTKSCLDNRPSEQPWTCLMCKPGWDQIGSPEIYTSTWPWVPFKGNPEGEGGEEGLFWTILASSGPPGAPGSSWAPLKGTQEDPRPGFPLKGIQGPGVVYRSGLPTRKPQVLLGAGALKKVPKANLLTPAYLGA